MMDFRHWYGTWWIPGRDTEPQPGTLTSDASGDLRLDLVGGFDLSERTPLEGGGYAVGIGDAEVPVILGTCEGMSITLLDCMTLQSRHRGFGEAPAYHQLRASRALVGTYLETAADRVFTTSRVGLENLTTFLQMYPFSVDLDDNITTTRPQSVTVEVDGWTYTTHLQLPGPRYAETRGGSVLEMPTKAVLEITAPEPLALDDFDGAHLALMDLLTLASGTGSGIISPSLVREPPAGVARGATVETFGPRIHTAQPDEAGQRDSRFLFTCADRSFGDLMRAWMPLRRSVESACNVFFGMHYSPPGFTDNKLLLSAVAAESLESGLNPRAAHMPEEAYNELLRTVLDAVPIPAERGWVRQNMHNRPTFRQKLESLASRPAPEAVALFMPDTSVWARALVSARNGLAHNGNGKHDDIFRLNMETQMVLNLVFMSQLGLSAETQVRAARAEPYLLTQA